MNDTENGFVRIDGEVGTFNIAPDTFHTFRPARDITAHELAVILETVGISAPGRVLDRLDPAVRRHFKPAE